MECVHCRRSDRQTDSFIYVDERVCFESSVLGIVPEYDELVSEYGELVLPEYGGVAPGYGETGNMFTGCGWDIW